MWCIPPTWEYCDPNEEKDWRGEGSDWSHEGGGGGAVTKRVDKQAEMITFCGHRVTIQIKIAVGRKFNSRLTYYSGEDLWTRN